MALTPSNMLPLGTSAPDFSLPDTRGTIVTLNAFKDAQLLLMAFICNHCPFVKHIRAGFADLARDYESKGVAFVAINANDIQAYPDDNMDNMQSEVLEAGYTFPYLLDETQSVALAYDAACTPDFYLFDENRALIYRGQMDSSRPGNGIPVTAEDLRKAMDAALTGQAISQAQVPSVGCNIKWKPGNAPN